MSMYIGVEAGMDMLIDALTSTDTEEMRRICFSCKVPQNMCDGECRRIHALLRGEPDPGEKYAGTVRLMHGYSREEADALAEECGCTRNRMYILLKRGLTIEEIKNRMIEHEKKKEIAKQRKDIVNRLAVKYGVDKDIIYRRLIKGWTEEQVETFLKNRQRGVA